MIRTSYAAWLITLAWAFSLALPAMAADTEGVVTGTGHATIKRTPQLLRVQFVITARAKDLAGAVAKLKEAQTAASRKLFDLGAAEKSIEIGSTRLGAGPADARTQYAQYMQEIQQMAMDRAGMGATAKPPAKQQIVTVSSTLKAEWPLKLADDDDLFLIGQNLQDKIRSAGIGKSDPKAMTPEEREAAEEANNSTGQNSAEPTFQYVCKIPKADRAAAYAEAFQKARQEATDLAHAAAAELASLRHLAASVTSPTATESGNSFMQTMVQQATGATATTQFDSAPDEATAPIPIPVTQLITVTASFAVK